MTRATPAPPESERGHRTRDLPFLLLWGGQSVSAAGDGMALLALPLLVLEQTSDPVLAALADRYPRHRVLIAVEQSESASPVVGFVAAGPADEQALAPEEPALPDDIAAITDLLVEPRWGRRGHGSRLLAATVDRPELQSAELVGDELAAAVTEVLNVVVDYVAALESRG